LIEDCAAAQSSTLLIMAEGCKNEGRSDAIDAGGADVTVEGIGEFLGSIVGIGAYALMIWSLVEHFLVGTFL
jgi:hypothetical protein